MSRRKTAILGTDGTAEFICGNCGQKHQLSISGPTRAGIPIRTRCRCACGVSHAVYLERRLAIRKEVQIEGKYSRHGKDIAHPMTVRNLSRTGLFFEVEQRNGIRPGDRLEVDFSFGDQLVTRVQKEVSVRWVEDETVGVEFTSGRRAAPLDPRYDLALAQYDPSSERSPA